MFCFFGIPLRYRLPTVIKGCLLIPEVRSYALKIGECVGFFLLFSTLLSMAPGATTNRPVTNNTVAGKRNIICMYEVKLNSKI